MFVKRKNKRATRSRGKTLIVRGASGSGKAHNGCHGSFPLLKCRQPSQPTFIFKWGKEPVYMTYMGNGLTTSVAQSSLWMGYIRGIENSRWALGYILLRKDGCLASKILLIFPSDKQRATTSANYQPELQQDAKQNIVGQTAAQIHLSAFTNKNFYSSPLLYRNPDYISEETKSYQQNPNVENLFREN